MDVVAKSPREVVLEMRQLSLYPTDEKLLFALRTHLRLFEAEGNIEAANLMREAIVELSILPPRTQAAS